MYFEIILLHPVQKKMTENGCSLPFLIRLLLAIDRILCLKALGITSPELIDVSLKHIFKLYSENGSRLGEIPRDISELLDEMLAIKLVTLREMLFYNVYRFSRFTAQSHNGVDKHVLFGKSGIEGSHSKLLIFVDSHC